MRELTKVIEIKNGKKYEIESVTTDVTTIFESLARDLVAKKLQACTWITSIKDRTNYDGTRTITVTYNNGCRALYTIKD